MAKTVVLEGRYRYRRPVVLPAHISLRNRVSAAVVLLALGVLLGVLLGLRPGDTLSNTLEWPADSDAGPAGGTARAKNLEQQGFFAKKDLGLNLAKKEEIFSRVVDAACKSAIPLASVVIFKDALEQRRSSVVMKSSWRRLTARFEDFLKQNPLHADGGLFFIDSSQTTPETEIKGIILAEVRRGGRPGTRRVIGTPLFVESYRWGLIQLADMIAYVVHRHYRKDSRFEGWFKSLEPKMRRSGGRLSGFGINEIPDLH